MILNQQNFRNICLANTTKIASNRTLDELINGVITEEFEYNSYLELVMVINPDTNKLEADSSIYNVVFKFTEADVTEDIFMFLSKHVKLFEIDKRIRFDNMVESIVGFTYDEENNSVVTVSVDFLRSIDTCQNKTLTNLSDIKYDLYVLNEKIYVIDEETEIVTDMK